MKSHNAPHLGSQPLRYKMVVEYHGGHFHGFQRQQHCLTVQAALEEAIAKVCHEEINLTCAGRTDAGVHARGQVVHFDASKDLEAQRLLQAVNFHLKKFKVVVTAVENLGRNSNFHARFDAKERYYIYKILNQAHRPIIQEGLCLWVIKPLQLDLMQKAASLMVGKHNFSNFRSSICQAHSAEKTLNHIKVYPTADQPQEINIHLSAPSFLHHQVRFIVGALLQVATGKESVTYISKLLNQEPGLNKPPVVPACGLYLEGVKYS